MHRSDYFWMACELLPSEKEGCVETPFLQLQNQRLLHKKNVDTFTDAQLWMCSPVSSMWRRLKEGNMNLEILLSYQPPLVSILGTVQHSSKALPELNVYYVPLYFQFWLAMWLLLCLQRRCVLAMLMLTTANMIKLSKKKEVSKCLNCSKYYFF